MPARSHQSLLDDYAAARAAGDDAAATVAWTELVARNFDRMKQSVKAFRFSAGGSRLPEAEQGSAVSEAYIRAAAMGRAFRHTEIGAFYAALHQCVLNSCKDYGRKELRHDRRAKGSLDERFDSGGVSGPYDGALAAHRGAQQERLRAAVEAEGSRVQAEQLVHWAISCIANANHRAVLEMTYCDEPLSGDEIAAKLGISPDNVYQCRRRGGKELERILRGL
jgi:DNA-directed RNA polymerase specialized sigma24 family protein